jgi:hypothetical protein
MQPGCADLLGILPPHLHAGRSLHCSYTSRSRRGDRHVALNVHPEGMGNAEYGVARSEPAKTGRRGRTRLLKHPMYSVNC